MARIFVCYRSHEDAYAAIALDDRLTHAFGGSAVFRASRSVIPGENYSDVILRAAKECDVMLVLVGPRWTEQLHDPSDDWVQLEIRTAIDNGTTVIPVLLDRARRLRKDELPPRIAAIAGNQYFRFAGRTINEDTAHIVLALERTLGIAGAPEQVQPTAGAVRPLVMNTPGTNHRTSIRLEMFADDTLELEWESLRGSLSGKIDRADLPVLIELLANAARKSPR